MYELGKGCISTVYKARNYDGSIVALKKYNQGYDFKDGQFSVTMEEVNHVNVAKVYDHFDDGPVFIAMEYCELGDLNCFLIKRSININEKNRFMVHMARGLHYLHTQNIVHGKIKPENVLFTNNTQDHSIVCKISDFSVSKIKTSKCMDMEQKGNCNNDLSEERDIYSLGSIYFAVQKNFHAHHQGLVSDLSSPQKDIEYLNETLQREKPTQDGFISSYFADSVDLGDLVFRMINQYPEGRYNMEEVLVSIIAIKEHEKLLSIMANHRHAARQLKHEYNEITFERDKIFEINYNLQAKNEQMVHKIDEQKAFMKQMEQTFVFQLNEKSQRETELQDNLQNGKLAIFQKFKRLEDQYMFNRKDWFNETNKLEEDNIKLQQEIRELEREEILNSETCTTDASVPRSQGETEVKEQVNLLTTLKSKVNLFMLLGPLLNMQVLFNV